MRKYFAPLANFCETEELFERERHQEPVPGWHSCVLACLESDALGVLTADMNHCECREMRSVVDPVCMAVHRKCSRGKRVTRDIKKGRESTLVLFLFSAILVGSDPSAYGFGLSVVVQHLVSHLASPVGLVIRQNAKLPVEDKSFVDLSVLKEGLSLACTNCRALPLCAVQAFPEWLRTERARMLQDTVMQHVRNDGAGHRVADAKESNPVPLNAVCHPGFASLIPDACDRRDNSQYNPPEVFSGVAR